MLHAPLPLHQVHGSPGSNPPSSRWRWKWLVTDVFTHQRHLTVHLEAAPERGVRCSQSALSLCLGADGLTRGSTLEKAQGPRSPPRLCAGTSPKALSHLAPHREAAGAELVNGWDFLHLLPSQRLSPVPLKTKKIFIN